MHPTKPPTPTEYAIIALGIAGLLIGFGVVALVMAFRAPAEKHEVAVALQQRGLWSLGLGLGVAVIFWLYRRLTG